MLIAGPPNRGSMMIFIVVVGGAVTKTSIETRNMHLFGKLHMAAQSVIR